MRRVASLPSSISSTMRISSVRILQCRHLSTSGNDSSANSSGNNSNSNQPASDGTQQPSSASSAPSAKPAAPAPIESPQKWEAILNSLNRMSNLHGKKTTTLMGQSLAKSSASILYNRESKSANPHSLKHRINSQYGGNHPSISNQNIKDDLVRPSTARDSTTISLLTSSADWSGHRILSHRLHINAGRNNTFVTLASPTGDVLCWSSAGSVGLKKAKRGTSDAGSQAAVSLTEKIKAKGISLHAVHVILKGFGPGREQAFRAIRMAGLRITMITDTTPVRHAGCRPRKKRSL
ncbi:hypothetical protein SeMB42_g01416 [Synchytrium endobioticum]|uniref:Ribosomal protein S11 n=1 Tax=Synchytrium endobioticum TaxID=286115 RepID=A0A507DNI6_9FUNG|nr:hypothetical protein SeLEV6574_g00544 [Synchytrium endobioticum]TPX52438.1 hypothetical protein SeMB42_g01416 [Synchytrium endobioticum]